jgi:hypothetical protein
MTQLTINSFLSAVADHEVNQYRILQLLRGYYDEFYHNRLYPHLAHLVELVAQLETLLSEQADLQSKLPQSIKKIDLKNKKIEFESAILDDGNSENVFELIRWALPRLKEVLEEGRHIFDFVEENLTVEQVGILPVYREEGYYFVPEHRADRLHLLRYEVSLFSSNKDRFRTLKTKTLGSLRRESWFRTPASIKLELIAQHQDLPNPATFICETNLEFPFDQTILPIAKRKLITRLFS